ncbi:LysR substrate-binding domain-containing protein [Dolichospermum circinale CS-1225]|uniref:LysR substrate-binding domain-containing protein n=1 Tax=Dolichospermum circinale CS-537/01 TaxID=3021739 RepID=A0ABT5A8L3_9CYAN|nr:LysR family transcriptional regulator [Dolichospermum circinale]MDB9458699.1 LysR substrate-binding domain-containing protein [Dolichospermum circinale CS-545/17]MDB9468934.1 LysR substrate-binding domain-containing protein [Dolichospermum circinale CS-539/09]MDB9469397.1 LysR substrate-binding domain-containing protein [Dolichospermum circinale CS-539]MDB9487421.1 LysR substrate-binding domain-containing protein [Dolichospermum circinale CS-537/01]MDB9522338.1 LysR substrate-binding domain
MNQATLHQLKVFEAAARHGSFTRAAEELFLTQPTISMQIKQLTKSVGLPLFEQVGKRLYLTEAGRELFATCRQIFETMDKFQMTVADLKGLKQGQLRLAVITTAKYIIPRLLGPFCQLYPGIDISLQVTNHELILDRMMNNLDDLYIMSQIPDHFDVNFQPFLENPLVVFAPANHPLAKEKNIPIERLGEERFIMREPGSGTRSAVQSLLEKHGVKVKVKLELGSNEAIKQAIAGGLGISVLSRHTLLTDAAEFSILDVQNFPIKRDWYMVYPAGKQLSIIAHTYYEYLLDAAKKITEQGGLIPDYNSAEA